MGSGRLQEPGPEHSEGQEQPRGDWPGGAAGHQHLDPVKICTDVGVDPGPVGSTAARSPAHDSNLNPQTSLFTGQGATGVTLGSVVTLGSGAGEPGLAASGEGAGAPEGQWRREGQQEGLWSRADRVHILPPTPEVN